MNAVSQDELLKALDALVMVDSVPPVGPDDITLSLLCNRYGYGTNRHKAKKLALRLEAEGKLVSVGKRIDEHGMKVMAWRLADDTK